MSEEDPKLRLIVAQQGGSADPDTWNAPEPVEDDDWSPEAFLPDITQAEAARTARRDKKERKAYEEAAAKEFGTDFIRKLRTVRDPRERIIFSAESVFARKGFAGARTQEIASLANVNKAMIHYYFDSKEKLYHAVLDKILFDLIKLQQESVRGELSFPKQLERFLIGFFDYVATHKNFSRLTSMELGSNDRYLIRLAETFFKPLFDRGVAFIRAGVSAGAFQKINARHFLISIYDLTMGYFSNAEFVGMMFGEDPLSEKMLKERRDMVLDVVFHCLGCKRP
jgi:TetR/AcrR family transcriptional regulator